MRQGWRLSSILCSVSLKFRSNFYPQAPSFSYHIFFLETLHSLSLTQHQVSFPKLCLQHSDTITYQRSHYRSNLKCWRLDSSLPAKPVPPSHFPPFTLVVTPSVSFLSIIICGPFLPISSFQLNSSLSPFQCIFVACLNLSKLFLEHQLCARASGTCKALDLAAACCSFFWQHRGNSHKAICSHKSNYRKSDFELKQKKLIPFGVFQNSFCNKK